MKKLLNYISVLMKSQSVAFRKLIEYSYCSALKNCIAGGTTVIQVIPYHQNPHPCTSTVITFKDYTGFTKVVRVLSSTVLGTRGIKTIFKRHKFNLFGQEN